MIAYNKSGLKISEFYYKMPGHPGSGLDIARCYFQPEALGGTHQSVFHTLQIDLTQEEDSILAGMKKDNRQSIRYAERDGVRTESQTLHPSKDWLLEFYAFYDSFAASKNLAPANRARLGAMGDAGMLDLSRAIDAQGETLVWHCTLLTESAARLMHSASMPRDAAHARLVGRANCFLHWKDMQKFRQAGLRTYDFGGWYAGNQCESKLRINKFKESFGGQVVQLYNIDKGLTLRGALAIRARHLMEAWQGKGE
jgi:hypothetical protein